MAEQRTYAILTAGIFAAQSFAFSLPPVSLKSARAAQHVIAALSKGLDQLSGVRRRVLRLACGWRKLSTLKPCH